jgi:hypothetical protein
VFGVPEESAPLKALMSASENLTSPGKVNQSPGGVKMWCQSLIDVTGPTLKGRLFPGYEVLRERVQ